MENRLEFALISSAITTLVTDIRTLEFGGLDLRPKYQRNYIWSNDFKNKLIYSIIRSYPIGNIIIRQLKEPNEKGAKYEVVDGQQRLQTIYDFIEGNYEIYSDFSRKIIEAIQDIYGEKTDPAFEKLQKRLNNKGKIRLKYSDLPTVIRGRFEAFNISVAKIIESSDEDITEYFRFLQNQERLRAGEILHSLSNAKMEKYLLQIEDLDAFCKIIGFNNDRREFDKLFYNILGVLDHKISLGTPDEIINKYVTTQDKLMNGQAEVSRLLDQINQITTDFKGRRILNKVKKRYVKYLMLLMGLGYVDFTTDTENKLKSLEMLDNKLSVFFSAKPNVVQSEFKMYAPDVIEEFRSIALITKGAQTLKRVENRMQIFSYYLENIQEKTKTSGITMI